MKDKEYIMGSGSGDKDKGGREIKNIKLEGV